MDKRNATRAALRVLNQEKRVLEQTRESLVAAKYKAMRKYSLFFQSVDASNIQNMDKDLNLESVRVEMDQNEEKSNSLLAQIGELVENGNDEMASQVINEHVALLLKRDMVDDMKNPTKQYFDINANSCGIKDAYFAINPNQKLVKKNNDYYLLEPGQSMDDPASMERARLNFQKNKSSIRSLKVQIKDYRDNEKLVHDGRIDAIDRKLSDNEDKRESVGSGDSASLQHRPRPGVVLTPMKKTSAFSRTDLKQIARLETQFTQKPPATNRQFLNQIEDIQNRRVRAFLFGSLGTSEAEMRNNPASSLAGSQKMTTLIKNMAMFGRDPTNPAVTSIVNDYDRLEMQRKDPQAQNKAQEQAPEEPRNEPTPSTTPTPFKKDPY